MTTHPSIDKQIQNCTEAYKIHKLLNGDCSKQIQLTEKQIRAAVRKLIEVSKLGLGGILSDACWIFDLLEAHFSQQIELTDEEIRAAVRKIIEIPDSRWLDQLLIEHFSKKIQLTDEEIIDTVSRWIEVRMDDDTELMYPLLREVFPKLTEVQIDLIRKKTDPEKIALFSESMAWFLRNRNVCRKLSLGSFRWFVKISQPLHIKSFWRRCYKQLQQNKRFIVEERLVDFERQKMIATLKKRLSKALWEDLERFKLFVQYLELSSWKDLRYLLYDPVKVDV